MNAQHANRPQLIVFLGTAHDNGGTSILASNLAAAMRKHGHRVEEWYLFSSDGDLPPGARVFYHTKRTPFALLTVFWRVVAALRHAAAETSGSTRPLAASVQAPRRGFGEERYQSALGFCALV